MRRTLSDSGSDRPDGATLYSERLLGLWDECPVCSSLEKSTGWLLEREGVGPRWYVELQCTGCGSRGKDGGRRSGATWRGEDLKLPASRILRWRNRWTSQLSNRSGRGCSRR